MKKSIFIILLSCYGCFGQEKNCANYRTGKFNYVLENRPELIIRTDSTQIELNPITKVEVYSKIKWKSDCEYEMIYEKVLNYPEDVSHMIGQKINVKIIETSSYGYKVHATSPRINVILEFTNAD